MLHCISLLIMSVLVLQVQTINLYLFMATTKKYVVYLRTTPTQLVFLHDELWTIN